ncbi:HD-GYP domain-containing protein [Heliobacterium chlorum]|uniref:HD-GYP domain-containing protein n=1 Tax=Heliobacterium chlorum TaxID=2698 RepID=A0ABR7T137_HELCL|nr:HD-GYP domain-containing protein [Heliobacterium chlorum]
MNRIHVEAIHKGLILDQHIYTKSGALLLPRGTSLNERHIPYLKNLGIEYIEVTPKLARKKLGSFSLDRSKDISDEEAFESPILPREAEATEAVEDRDFYHLLREDLSQMVKQAVINYSQKGGHVADIEAITGMFRELVRGRNRILYLLDIKSVDAYTFRHSVNVAVLSVLVGINMGLSEGSIRNIALGGLYHDLGKKRIPPEVLWSDRPLDRESRQKIEEHPRLGYEILHRDKDIPEEVALIALQHQERMDGSGYPKRLTGDSVHLFSQIVSVADVYEAMTSSRQYRRGFNPVETVEYLMGASGVLFPERVVKALLNSITLFRIGSVIQLSNNDCGVVIQANRRLPSRPIVRIVFNEHQIPLDHEKIIDLSNPVNLSLYIIRSFN